MPIHRNPWATPSQLGIILALVLASFSLPVLASSAFSTGSGNLTPALQDDETFSREVRESYLAAADGKYQRAIDHAKAALEQKADADLLVHTGSCYFMLADMKQAIAYYNQAIALDPKLPPRLWQRGLALYYAGRYEDGKRQFETHQTYNRQDVENAVWHMLCHAQVADLETARKELIPIQYDTRIPMKSIHELYAGTGSVEQVWTAVQEVDPDPEAPARRQAAYYAHLYVGLYQEMTGETEAAGESMRKATQVNPIPRQYLMGRVADVHLKLRKPEKSDTDPSSQSSDKQPPDSSDR